MPQDTQETIRIALDKLRKFAHINRRMVTANYCLEQLKTLILDENLSFHWQDDQYRICLFESMIISYMSCYNSNAGGTVKLDHRAVYRYKSEEVVFSKELEVLFNFHEDVDKYRSGIIAHNGINVDKMIYDIEENEINIYSIIDMMIFGENSYDSFEQLFRTTQKFVENKINKILNKLEKETGLKVNFYSK